MPSKMCIDPIHNKKGIFHLSGNMDAEDKWDANTCAMGSLYDMDLISVKVPVILDNSKSWHHVLTTSMKLGSSGMGHVQGVSRTDLRDKKPLKISLADYNIVLHYSRGTVAVGLPPAWVDVPEEIASSIQRVRVKMGELAKAHAKALMPSFGDGKEDQHRIEALTQEITDLLKNSEKRLQRFSVGAPSEDSNIRRTYLLSTKAP